MVRDLELGAEQSLSYMLLVLGFGIDGYDNLVNLESDHCTLVLCKVTVNTYLESKIGVIMRTDEYHCKVLSCKPLRPFPIRHRLQILSLCSYSTSDSMEKREYLA